MDPGQRDEGSRGGFKNLEFSGLLLQNQVIPSSWLVEESSEGWAGDSFSWADLPGGQGCCSPMQSLGVNFKGSLFLREM